MTKKKLDDFNIYSYNTRSKFNLANYVHYSNKDSKITFGNESIIFGGKTLKRVKETKFRGVIIDENLNWNSQIPAKLNILVRK